MLMVCPGTTLTLNGTGSLNVIGHPGDAVMVAFYPGPGFVSPAKIELKDHSVLTLSSGNIVVGKSGGEGIMTMSDYSKITVTNTLQLGFGASGAMTMNDHSTANVSGDGGGDVFDVGVHPGAPSKLTLNNNSIFTVGYGSALIGHFGGDGTLEMTGSSTFEHLSTEWSVLFVGLDVDHATGAISTGAVTMNGGTSPTDGPFINVQGTVSVGNSGGEGTVTMHDYSRINAHDGIEFGVNDSTDDLGVLHSAKGTLEMYEHAAITGGLFRVGQGSGSGYATMNDNSTANVRSLEANSGSLTLTGHASFTAAAQNESGIWSAPVTLQENSSFTATGDGTYLIVGGWGNQGHLDVQGSATLTVTELRLGYNRGGVADDSPSVVAITGTGATATIGKLTVGADGNQGSHWDQNAGHTTVASPVILGEFDYTDDIVVRSSGSGILNLKSGTFSVPSITTNSSPISTWTTDDVLNPNYPGDAGTMLNGVVNGTVNFNGGTLQASGNSADFINVDPVAPAGSSMTLNVQSLGAKIDTNTHNVAVSLPLTEDATSTGGGLTKLGAGTLLLTAKPTYAGNTDIQDGTLQFATSVPVTLTTVTGSSSGTLSVCDGTTLTATSIHVGTLSIGGAPIVIAAAAAVPEPSTMILLVLAGIGLLFQAWRKT